MKNHQYCSLPLQARFHIERSWWDFFLIGTRVASVENWGNQLKHSSTTHSILNLLLLQLDTHDASATIRFTMTNIIRLCTPCDDVKWWRKDISRTIKEQEGQMTYYTVCWPEGTEKPRCGLSWSSETEENGSVEEEVRQRPVILRVNDISNNEDRDLLANISSLIITWYAVCFDNEDQKTLSLRPLPTHPHSHPR